MMREAIAIRRPGHLPRAQAPLLDEVRRRAAGPTEPAREAVVRREGTDASVFAYGPMVRTALEAAEAAEEEGWDLEVVDLRSLSPLDDRTDRRVGQAHRPCGRRPRGGPRLGIGAEVAARIQERPSTTSRRRCCAPPGSTPLPAGQARGVLAARRRPHPRPGRAVPELLSRGSGLGGTRRQHGIRDFKLPDLGEGLEEGEIVAWHVEVGDVIDLNQTVAEIETAKAVVAVPSPFAGKVVERIGEVGETLEVGKPVFLASTRSTVSPSGRRRGRRGPAQAGFERTTRPRRPR
jgi:hypothetical protein